MIVVNWWLNLDQDGQAGKRQPSSQQSFLKNLAYRRRFGITTIQASPRPLERLMSRPSKDTRTSQRPKSHTPWRKGKERKKTLDASVTNAKLNEVCPIFPLLPWRLMLPVPSRTNLAYFSSAHNNNIVKSSTLCETICFDHMNVVRGIRHSKQWQGAK